MWQSKPTGKLKRRWPKSLDHYIQAVLPQARIVVDKFHVLRMANEALEKVGKGLGKELKANQRRTLNGDRRILLKRAHDVSDRERLIIETGQGPSHSSW